MFKRFVSAGVCALVLLSALLFAAEVVNAQQIRVTVNGTFVNFPDAQPIIIEGRTLVPMRGVFEQMGFVGDWNPHTETSTLVRSGMVVAVRRGDPFFTVNGIQNFPEVPPQLLGGRFMIPLRAVAESTGAGVNWNEHTRTVIITTGNVPVTPPVMPIAPPPQQQNPSITISSQTGQKIAGVPGFVDFQMLTQNMPNGTYPVALRGNVPNGITLQSSDLIINGNTGTVRLHGNNTTQTGTFRITVSVNLGAARGWIDQDLTLVISQPQLNQNFALTVGQQGGNLAQGSSGSVQYSVTTQGLPNGNYSVTLTAPIPQGVSLSSNTFSITNNSGAIMLNSNGTTPAGAHPIHLSFTLGTGPQAVTVNRNVILTIGGQAGQNFVLNIGTPSNSLTQGTAANVQYMISTQNIPGGSHSVTLVNPIPQGVSLASSNTFIVNNNSGAIVLGSNGNTPVGQHTVHLAFTIGSGAQAVTLNRQVTLTVTGAATPTISGGTQTTTIHSGAAHGVSFTFNVQNAAQGHHNISGSAGTNFPPGVFITGSSLHVQGNTGTIVFFVDTTHGPLMPGVHPIPFDISLLDLNGNFTNAGANRVVNLVVS